MARPRYGSIKRTKELKRKAKREAKLARKHARKATNEVSPDLTASGGSALDTGASAGGSSEALSQNRPTFGESGG